MSEPAAVDIVFAGPSPMAVDALVKLIGQQGPAGADGSDGAAGPAGPPGIPGTTTWAGITDKPETFAPSAHTLDSHSDVIAPTPALNDRLMWDGTAWVNTPQSVAVGAAVTYWFCDDVIFAGTTPVWHEFETDVDSGATGSHTATGSTYSEMDRYVTPAIGVTAINGGEWRFVLYAKTSTALSAGQLKADVYRVNSAGAIVGTVIGTATTAPFANITTSAAITAAVYIPAQSGWNATDRIGVVVSGKRNGGAATITFEHNSSTGMLSSMATPIALMHNQLPGLNDGDFQHLTAAQKTNATAASATPSTPSIRALGTGATEAAAGNDSRLGLASTALQSVTEAAVLAALAGDDPVNDKIGAEFVQNQVTEESVLTALAGDSPVSNKIGSEFLQLQDITLSKFYDDFSRYPVGYILEGGSTNEAGTVWELSKGENPNGPIIDANRTLVAGDGASQQGLFYIGGDAGENIRTFSIELMWEYTNAGIAYASYTVGMHSTPVLVAGGNGIILPSGMLHIYTNVQGIANFGFSEVDGAVYQRIIPMGWKDTWSGVVPFSSNAPNAGHVYGEKARVSFAINGADLYYSTQESCLHFRHPAACETIEFTQNPAAGDTIQIGSVTYTWRVALGGPDNEIVIGTDIEDSLSHLRLALYKGYSSPAVYSNTVENPDACMAAANVGTPHTAEIRAWYAGPYGNDIAIASNTTGVIVGHPHLRGGERTPILTAAPRYFYLETDSNAAGRDKLHFYNFHVNHDSYEKNKPFSVTAQKLAGGTLDAEVVQGGTETTSVLRVQATSGAGTTGSETVLAYGTNGNSRAITIGYTGAVGIGNLTPVLTTGWPKAQILGLETLGSLLLTNSITNNANKDFIISFGHYSTAWSVFAGVRGQSTTSANTISYGGATASIASATKHSFYTGSTTTTTTGTERLRIDSSGNTTLFGGLILTPQALSGHGALAATNLTTATTTYVNDGTEATTSTLAAGTNGQVKTLCFITDGGYDVVITVTNAAWGGSGTITMNDANDNITLQYLGAKWQVLTNNGCTLG